ncbi:MAG: nitrile hydratase subunit alpha [Candidatus Lambdaproteobacteria bacterium]|nr:nitrile hydratase subunit alpha [Candidatus Lambdaproteobacteria bacterium]
MPDPHNPYDHGPDFHPAGPPDEHELLERALRELLIEKGVVAPDAIRRSLDLRDHFTPEPGARLVARMWTDPTFKALALRDARAAAKQLDVTVGLFDLNILENTPQRHHVVVCTLCSCFHSVVLGNAPAWYKSVEYRSRVAVEPRKVLAEFGTVIPAETEIRVVDSTAEIRFMVMPERPAGTEGLREEELVPLITQESMIGVTRLGPPR